MAVKKYWKFVVLGLLVLGWFYLSEHRSQDANVEYISEALVSTNQKEFKIKFYKDLNSKRLFILNHKGKRVYVDELKIEKDGE